MEDSDIGEKEIDETYEKLKQEGESRGYFINPDIGFTKNLIKGLLVNQKRYGYWSCPCRLGSGIREKDLDIICPCDYRDIDINEYGCCYCSLYVSKMNKDKNEFMSIPERRNKGGNMDKENKIRVWRCKVCGYLCAREHAPDICPICGVEHDRFEEFEY